MLVSPLPGSYFSQPFLMCYVLFIKAFKTEKPFVAIFWGLNHTLTRLLLFCFTVYSVVARHSDRTINSPISMTLAVSIKRSAKSYRRLALQRLIITVYRSDLHFCLTAEAICLSASESVAVNRFIRIIRRETS